MSIRTVDDSLSRWSLKTGETAWWVVGCQDRLVLGHPHACPVPCESYPLVFQVVPTVVLPITHNSNHGLFSLRLNFLEVHIGFLHPSVFSTKCTWVIDRRLPQEWVWLFPREEQSTQLFPAASLHALWDLYLFPQYVNTLFGQLP